jgi:16S rRNA G1207 methylase RsmC
VTRAPADPLHKGTLAFRQHGVGVQLEVLEGVFAGASVDAGTRQLLRWLAADRYAGAGRVLDLGCGYGPLGLWLAAAGAQRQVVAVDRDARAVEATQRGAVANGLADRVEARGSLGYDDVGAEPFDLVVSNIPAKVGPAALAHLVLDAGAHLGEGGSVAVVVVDRLAAQVADLLTDPAVELLDVRPTSAYTVYEYRFGDASRAALSATTSASSFERGLYRRGEGEFSAGGLRWSATSSFSIDEFDSLGRATVAAVEAFVADRDRVRIDPAAGPVLVAGVGQGHLPLALRAAGVEAPLCLVDRDLLALRTAAHNLGGEGADVALQHVPRPGVGAFAGASLVLVALPEREPVAVTAALLADAFAGAGSQPVLLHGRVADVTRVVELLGRRGVRLDGQRHKVGGHGAFLGRTR